MSHPGFRSAWKLSAAQFGKEFREVVDTRVAATPISPNVDAYAEWRNMLLADKSSTTSHTGQSGPRADPGKISPVK
jgi:hypothetical protein